MENSLGIEEGAGERSLVCNSSVSSTFFGFIFLLLEPAARSTFSCLAAFRSMVRAVCIADLTSGRRSSSTRLFHLRKRVAYRNGPQFRGRLDVTYWSASETLQAGLPETPSFPPSVLVLSDASVVYSTDRPGPDHPPVSASSCSRRVFVAHLILLPQISEWLHFLTTLSLVPDQMSCVMIRFIKQQHLVRLLFKILTFAFPQTSETLLSY